MVIGTSLMIYLLNYVVIYSLYLTYYSESVWGVLIAIMDQIIYFEHNLIYSIPILLIFGFIGGIISKNSKNGILSSLFSGITIVICWIVILARFLPKYYMSNISFFTIIEVIFRSFLIFAIYLVPSFIGGYIMSYRKFNEAKFDLQKIETICPYCHQKFESNPLYCCYCNNKIPKNNKISISN